MHRDELITRLVEAGWTSCSSSVEWDLEKEGTRVLFATEKGDMGIKKTLVRVEGEASIVRAIIG